MAVLKLGFAISSSLSLITCCNRTWVSTFSTNFYIFSTTIFSLRVLLISLLTHMRIQRFCLIPVLSYCARGLIIISIAHFAPFQSRTGDSLGTLIFSITVSSSSCLGSVRSGHAPLLVPVRTCEQVHSRSRTVSSVLSSSVFRENYSTRFARASSVVRSQYYFFPSRRSESHLSLFLTIRIPCARARIMHNLFFVAPRCITFGCKPRVLVEFCVVLQLSWSPVFLAHITHGRHGADYRTIGGKHGHLYQR